jgi:hypothetical protein
MPRKYCIPKFFARRGISCDQLPEHVYRRVKEIIEKLEDGAHFQSVDRKRMDFDKSKVSIPIVDQKPDHSLVRSYRGIFDGTDYSITYE